MLVLFISFLCVSVVWSNTGDRETAGETVLYRKCERAETPAVQSIMSVLDCKQRDGDKSQATEYLKLEFLIFWLRSLGTHDIIPLITQISQLMCKPMIFM